MFKSKKRNYIFLGLFITIFVLIFYIFSFIIPIYFTNPNKVYDQFTTISDNPKNFNYGINLNTSQPNLLVKCEQYNFFHQMKPRYVMIHNSEETSPGKFVTDIDIFEFYKNNIFDQNYELNGIYGFFSYEKFDTLQLKRYDFCNQFDEQKMRSKDTILKYKSDAINNPKQQVPETTLTQEEIRKQLEEQEKNESAR